MNEEDNGSVKPVKKFRVGGVTAAVWKNDNGFSVTLEKSYRDSAGEWQRTNTLYHDDILCALRVLDRAERFMAQ